MVRESFEQRLKEVTEQARQPSEERGFWVGENTSAKVRRGSMFNGFKKQQRGELLELLNKGERGGRGGMRQVL